MPAFAYATKPAAGYTCMDVPIIMITFGLASLSLAATSSIGVPSPRTIQYAGVIGSFFAFVAEHEVAFPIIDKAPRIVYSSLLSTHRAGWMTLLLPAFSCQIIDILGDDTDSIFCFQFDECQMPGIGLYLF